MFKVVHVGKVLRSAASVRTANHSLKNRTFCCRRSEDNETRKPLDFKELKFESKVPLKPHVSAITELKIDRIRIDDETIQLLERVSLVNVDNKEAVRTLEDSIEFASKILHIDTTDVNPLYTVLEHQDLHLRSDIVNDGNCCDVILSNAKVTEEEYFVAPPGNIPLEQSESKEKRL